MVNIYDIACMWADYVEGNKFEGCLSALDRAKIFKTMILRFSRRSGHTTAAIRLATNKFDHVLFVVPNEKMIKIIKEKLSLTGCNKDVCVITPDRLDFARGRRYQAVIVDPASLLSGSQIDEIYRFTVQDDPFYIFLG